jgi:hypothetical protein
MKPTSVGTHRRSDERSAAGLLDDVGFEHASHPAHLAQGNQSQRVTLLDELLQIAERALEFVDRLEVMASKYLDLILQLENSHDAREVDALGCELLDLLKEHDVAFGVSAGIARRALWLQ